MTKALQRVVDHMLMPRCDIKLQFIQHGRSSCGDAWRDYSFATVPSRILFVSRRSSLRSVLAEACLTHMGGHNLVAQYCGQPGFVERSIHPAAMAALAGARIPVPVMPPRPWTDLWRAGTPRLDLVVTLDERVMASEPTWPGQPIATLWAFEDAALLADPDEAAPTAMRILYSLQRRLELQVNLPLGRADSSAIRSDLRDLGRMV